MLGLTDNQFERPGKQYESRTGAFNVMSMRYTIVRKGLINAEASPTISRALDSVQRLQDAADALAYKQKMQRLAEEANIEATYALESANPKYDDASDDNDSQPVVKPAEFIHDRDQAIASAQLQVKSAHGISADTHESRLRA